MSGAPTISDPATYPAKALAALRARLSARLAPAAPALTQDELREALARAFPFNETGVGKPIRTPDRYWFKIAGKRTTVSAWAQSKILDGDERPSVVVARQWFSEPDSTTPMASCCAHVGFPLPWAHAMDVLRALVQHRDAGELAALSDDGGYGFVLDSHVGYVPYELSDEETVYRVARWHPF